jgi:hypothetical protein
MPNIKSRQKKKYRLTRVNSARGANAGAPGNAALPTVSVHPADPAHHGHYLAFPVGAARRVGAWRRAGVLGLPRGKRGR